MRKEDKVEQRGGKVIEDREEKEEWKDEKKMERQQHKGKEWSEEVRGGVGIWTSPSLTTGLSLGSWQDCPPLCQYRKTGQGSCWQYASTGTDTHAGSVNSQTLVCSSLSWRHLGEEVNVYTATAWTWEIAFGLALNPVLLSEILLFYLWKQIYWTGIKASVTLLLLSLLVFISCRAGWGLRHSTEGRRSRRASVQLSGMTCWPAWGVISSVGNILHSNLH